MDPEDLIPLSAQATAQLQRTLSPEVHLDLTLRTLVYCCESDDPSQPSVQQRYTAQTQLGYIHITTN
jgi:hypothetical protein